MNLVYVRLVADASPEHRETIDESLAESVDAWAPYLFPAGTDDRPADAPAWWHGDDEAAEVTQTGTRALQGRTGPRG